MFLQDLFDYLMTLKPVDGSRFTHYEVTRKPRTIRHHISNTLDQFGTIIKRPRSSWNDDWWNFNICEGETIIAVTRLAEGHYFDIEDPECLPKLVKLLKLHDPNAVDENRCLGLAPHLSAARKWAVRAVDYLRRTLDINLVSK